MHQPPRGARLLLDTLYGERRHALLAMGAGLAWVGTRISTPHFIQRGIDASLHADEQALVHALIAVAALGTLAAGLAGLRRYFAQALGVRIENALRIRLFSHLLRLDLAFHARRSAGELVSRSASDLQQIQQPFVNVPISLVTAVMALGITVVLVRMDALLALAALGPTFGVFLFARLFMDRLGASAARLQRTLAGVASTIEESVAGIRAVKGLGLEAVEQRRVEAHTEAVREAALGMNRVRALYLPLIDLMPATGLVGVLWLGGLRVAEGALSVGTLVQFYYYVVMLVSPLRMMGMTFAQLQRATASANLIADLLHTEPTIREPRDGGKLADEAPEIRFESVAFQHGAHSPLFTDLTLRVRAGETVAVVGATGSGKSTLVALLARLIDVDAGRITLDGVDVRQLALTSLRARIGVVFDDPFLFAGSVRDNIAFGRPRATSVQIEAAARAAGAHEFIEQLEHGYDTAVGERGLRLSGGQRQRVSLARALVTQPSILILDAATSAVDASTEDAMHTALRGVLAGRTTLLIANRVSTLQLADRVLFLDQGRIVDAGPHRELARRNARYRAVLALGREDSVAEPHAPALGEWA